MRKESILNCLTIEQQPHNIGETRFSDTTIKGNHRNGILRGMSTFCITVTIDVKKCGNVRSGDNISRNEVNGNVIKIEHYH